MMRLEWGCGMPDSITFKVTGDFPASVEIYGEDAYNQLIEDANSDEYKTDIYLKKNRREP